jgi:hypothetical protein
LRGRERRILTGKIEGWGLFVTESTRPYHVVVLLRVLLSIFLIAPFVAQTDPQLAQLHSTLTAIRVSTKTDLRARGNPQMTLAKHQLRDWIEAHLTPWQPNWDEKSLEKRLNDALKNGALFCDEKAPCANDQNSTGYLGDIEIRYDGLLRVKTRLGILCGSDESAYLYKWTGKQWQRIWESERNNYTGDQYDPQTIYDVIVSTQWANGRQLDDHIVLTLGRNPWCTSNWHSNYYRIWKVDQTGSRLLLEDKEIGFEDDLHGSIHTKDAFDRSDTDTVTIEFAIRSIDGGVHNREAVKKYAIRGDKVERVDPLALSPRDFVDEWLTHPQAETLAWSPDSSRAALTPWHNRLHSDFVSGDFIWPTRHCTQPDLWQVGFEMNTYDGNGKITSSKDYYFTVRWRPPYKFTMVAIAEQPSSACTERDPEADKHRSLFMGR